MEDSELDMTKRTSDIQENIDSDNELDPNAFSTNTSMYRKEEASNLIESTQQMLKELQQPRPAKDDKNLAQNYDQQSQLQT